MGTKMFRAGALLALAALAGGLAACSSGGGGSSDGPVTLQLAATTDGSADAYNQLIAGFKKDNPNIDIQTTFTPNDQFQANIPRAMGSSNGPDIVAAFPGIQTGPTAYTLQDSGLIVDQSGESWAKDLSDSERTVLGHDGFVGFDPIGYDSIGLVYNQDVFDQDGVTAPATWSDLLNLCDTFNAKGITPISLGLQTNYVAQFIPYALVSSTVYAADPSFDTELLAGKGSFSDSGWSEALNKFVELNQHNCFNKDFLGTTYDSMLQQVATGQAAMTVTVGPSLGPIRQADPKGTYVMSPLPAYDDASKNGVTQALSIGLAINKNSKNVDAAQKFVDYVNQPANLAILAAGYNVIPAGGGAAPAGLDAVAKAFTSMPTGIFPNQLWKGPTSVDTFEAGIQQLFTGQQTVDQVLKAMDQAYQPLN